MFCLGSGIFSTPGIVFAAAGSPCASIIVWIFSGFLSVIGALCYVELATGHVNSAAEAAYFEKAFHKSVSFSFLVVSFFTLSSGSIAIEATVFAQYFMAIFNIQSTILQGIVSVVLISTLAHLNLKGVEQSALIQQTMVIFKVIAVLMIISTLFFIPDSFKMGFNFASVSECFAGTTPAGLGLGILSALWAYSGYNSVCALSEEFRDPIKDLPFGVLFGMITVIALYLFCNFAYIRVIDPTILKNSDSIGYTFAMNTGGEVFAVILSIAIMLATMGAAHSTVFGQARLFHAAGRDGIFHEWFGRVNRGGIPANSTLALCAWSCILVLLGNNLSILIDYSGVAMWLFAAMAGLAVIILRKTADKEAFRIPCIPFSPAIFASACLAVVLSGFLTDFYPTLIVFSLMSAAVVYYIVKHGRKAPISY